MVKWSHGKLRVLVCGLILLLLTAEGVSASGGPHDRLAATVDTCAECHRTKGRAGITAPDASTTTTMCLSCHGTGLGANTNVLDGVYLSGRDDGRSNQDVGARNTTDGGFLLGGGFVSYKGRPVTSAHDLRGEMTPAWGNGGVRGQATEPGTAGLTCVSCHDPHDSTNYRILRETVNGRPVRVEQVDEGADKDYDTEQWGAGTSSLCKACHGAYYVTTADDAGTLLASGGCAHPVDMPYNYGNNANPETEGFEGYKLPLAQSGNGDLVVCMTCHLPHGSSAEMTALASNGPTGDSALLRLDNRGVCQVCHQM